MEEHECQSIQQMRGSMSQRSVSISPRSNAATTFLFSALLRFGDLLRLRRSTYKMGVSGLFSGELIDAKKTQLIEYTFHGSVRFAKSRVPAGPSRKI
jgi:hypothetical protein